MKTIIIFNDNKSKYSEEKVFDGKNALELSLEWAKKIGSEVCRITAENTCELVSKMAQLAKEKEAESVIYSYSDCPFLNEEVTKEILEIHKEFKSEYTFADGYPYGFAPEVIDAGTLNILAELSKTTQDSEGQKKVNRESIFNLIKTDINSFDVESVLAPNDWRLFRFAFHCEMKDNFLQCKSLYEKCGNKNLTADELSKIASTSKECLKTVPGFYNIQISDGVSGDCIYSPYVAEYSKRNKLSPTGVKIGMKYEDFVPIVDKIAEFSENAVVSLSAWGEALLNTDFIKMVEKVLSYEGLSVFVETDGLYVTDTLCNQLQNVVSNAKERTNGWQKLMVAVKIDAFTVQTYKMIHTDAKENDFETCVEAVAKLNNAVPGCVYPQMTRMNDNEMELENFYRYWNEKTNSSGGNLIIQKYDNYAGILKERKVADLSPLDRNICWHLRRDMTILSNGDVPVCKDCIFSEIAGNVFKDGLENVWKNFDKTLDEHIKNNYSKKCRECDEYYTFNF